MPLVILDQIANCFSFPDEHGNLTALGHSTDTDHVAMGRLVLPEKEKDLLPALGMLPTSANAKAQSPATKHRCALKMLIHISAGETR